MTHQGKGSNCHHDGEYFQWFMKKQKWHVLIFVKNMNIYIEKDRLEDSTLKS